MKVHLHIDHVVVDAASADPSHPGALSAALQADLSARLGNRPLPAGLQRESRRAVAAPLDSAFGAGRNGAVAPRIARAILREVDR